MKKERETDLDYFDAVGDNSRDMGHERGHFSDRPSAEEAGVVVVTSELADDQKRFAQEILAICKRNLTGMRKTVRSSLGREIARVARPWGEPQMEGSNFWN